MAPKRLLGLVLVLLGVLFGIRSLEMIPEGIEDLIFRWELILIGLGIYFMAERKGTTGGILFVIGLLFWIPDAFDLPKDLSIWPIVLLLLGLFFLFRGNAGKSPSRFKQRATPTGQEKSGDRFQETVIFGNSDRIINTDNLQGGDILSIFGEAHIDLTRCKWGEGEREIEVFFLFGGGTLHVPAEWELDMEVTPIFGSFSDKRQEKLQPSGSSKDRVRIIGFCIFGDGRIRN